MFILERLISVIAPHSCLGCDSEGSLICDRCRPNATIPVPSRCYRCRAATDNFSVCQRCGSTSALSQVWVSTEYKGLAKQLLQAFKFDRAKQGAEVIGSYMAEAMPHLAPGAIILPIPTASSRLRARGYDHTKLIAKVIAQQTGRQYQSLVGRLGQSRQVGSHREERLKQLNSAYYVKRSESVRGKRIVLVDDIVTTGGTLESVAKVLKRAGAKSVSAVVFAQKS